MSAIPSAAAKPRGKRRTTKARQGTARVLAAASEAAAEGKTRKFSGPLADLRQERFCLELVRDPNATAAAIRAGYSAKTAAQQASRLLRIVKVRDRLASLMGVLQGRRLARKRDLLRQLNDHMQWALTDLMEFTGLPATEFAAAIRHHPAGRWIREVEFAPPQYDRESASWSEPTVKRVKMVDAHQSRRLLADLMGWTARESAEVEPGSLAGGLLVLPVGRMVEVRDAPEAAMGRLLIEAESEERG